MEEIIELMLLLVNGEKRITKQLYLCRNVGEE